MLLRNLSTLEKLTWDDLKDCNIQRRTRTCLFVHVTETLSNQLYCYIQELNRLRCCRNYFKKTIPVEFTESIFTYRANFYKKHMILTELTHEYKTRTVEMEIPNKKLLDSFNYIKEFNQLNGWKQNTQETFPVLPIWVYDLVFPNEILLDVI
jgi:hypothetical protein